MPPSPKKNSRCGWCGHEELYVKYHDEEWGVPVRDDRRLFEFLILEGNQAGLSWLTILRKRENFRRAYAGFDPEKIARFTTKDQARLMADPGIIRNRLKVAAAVVNAKKFLEVQERHGSFSAFIWAFVDNKPVRNRWKSLADVPAVSPVSDAISREMKRLGFKFVGSTIIYAHMQATGMVNDHLTSCFRHGQV